MDEAKLAQVAEIVKSMSDAGMSVNEIKGQLSAMGISGEDMEQVFSVAKAQPTHSEIHDEVKKVREGIEAGEHMRPVISILEEAGAEAHEARERAVETSRKVDEAREDISRKIGEPVEKMFRAQEEMHREIKTITGLGNEVQVLKDMLIDIRAQIGAIVEINQKILDSNRRLIQQKSGERNGSKE